MVESEKEEGDANNGEEDKPEGQFPEEQQLLPQELPKDLPV